jgi:hypothetical protein
MHNILLLPRMPFPLQLPIQYSNIYPTRCHVTQFIISGNCSTCFGQYLHPSSEAQTTVSTASGICHTVTATCRYRGIVGTGLSVLWVAMPPTPTRIIIIFTERSHKFKFRGNQQRTRQNCSAMLTFPPHVSMLSSCTHTGSQILGGVLATVTQTQQRQPTGQLGNSFCSFAFTGRNLSFLCRSHK